MRLAIAAALMHVAVPAIGQELEPRAYSVSPLGTNFAVIAVARSSGSISFDPAVPIEGATATLETAALGYTRAIGFAGRSANIGVLVPYVLGTLEAKVGGSFQEVRRSGLADPSFRLAVNLHGAPAMNQAQFRDYRQKTNIGVSVAVVAPLGQYDPARLLNIGLNRWAFRPEIGISQRLGKWYVDLYAGAWLFTANHNFRGVVRRQDPAAVSQLHVIYTVTPRVWAAFDASLYDGGRTTVGSVRRADVRRNSRMGGTLSIRVRPQQSIKFTGSTGVVTSIGASFVSIGVAYQYQWGGGI